MDDNTFTNDYLETLAIYRKIAECLINDNILLVHGSCLMMEGKAILFTAASGTGKSTHTRLWREVYGDKVTIINDDKPLIKIENGEATIYGTPWCGKHFLQTNTSCKLDTIFELKRAPENKVEEMTIPEAIPIIIKQTYRPNNPILVSKTIRLLNDLIKTVNLKRLYCNMDPDAAIVANKSIMQ